MVDGILAAGHRIHGANIFAEGHCILHFSFDELASPYRFAIDLPQADTERLLLDHLRTLGLEVERNVEVTGLIEDDTGVVLNAPDSGLRADYVVGCDGAHSTIRQASGLSFQGDSPEEHFVLADVPLVWAGSDDEWHLWFHREGLLMLLPLSGGLYRVIADVGPAIWPLDESHLRALFEQRGPQNASLGSPTWMSSYRIEQRRLAEYRRGRVFMAGDAAHVYNPAGGQGMNTGIQDAFNLAWKLGMVLRGNAPESLLESYTVEREPVARSVAALTESITTLANLRHPISQQIRNKVMATVAGLELVETRFVGRLAELSTSYRLSPVVGQSGRWNQAGPLPGARAHNAPLESGRHLLELGRGRHLVLLFAGSHPEQQDLRAFSNIDRYMRQGYADEVITCLIARLDLEWEGLKILDPDGTIHEAYGAAQACVYLVRPDGYVGFRSLTSDPLPLVEHLTRVYEPPLREDGIHKN